jgi:hypothetical protein
MKVRELIAELQKQNPEAEVMFDTEAQHYDCHLVTVDSVSDLDVIEGDETPPEERHYLLGRPVVMLHEDHPHRSGCPKD